MVVYPARFTCPHNCREIASRYVTLIYYDPTFVACHSHSELEEAKKRSQQTKDRVSVSITSPRKRDPKYPDVKSRHGPIDTSLTPYSFPKATTNFPGECHPYN